MLHLSIFKPFLVFPDLPININVDCFMKRFRKILVGVDLAEGDRFVAGQIASSTQQAIDWARWLARENSGELCFFM